MGQDKIDIYLSSGKYDQKAFLYLIPYLFLVLPFLCYVYANALWHIPYPILHPVFFGIFLFSLFVSVGVFFIKPGKVRSDGLALIMGSVIGVIALYLHWTMWASVVQTDVSSRFSVETYGYFGEETGILYYLIHPHIAWRTVDFVSELGFWIVFTWSFWIIEAIGIVLAPFFAAVHFSSFPFCEETGKWMKPIPLPKFYTPENTEELIQHISENENEIKMSDFLKIHNQDGTEQENATYLDLTLYTLHREDHFVSISRNFAVVTGKHPTGADRLSFDSEEIAEFLRISTAAKDQLMQFADVKSESREMDESSDSA